jgi:hypothetical protein
MLSNSLAKTNILVVDKVSRNPISKARVYVTCGSNDETLANGTTREDGVLVVEIDDQIPGDEIYVQSSFDGKKAFIIVRRTVEKRWPTSITIELSSKVLRYIE